MHLVEMIVNLSGVSGSARLWGRSKEGLVVSVDSSEVSPDLEVSSGTSRRL